LLELNLASQRPPWQFDGLPHTPIQPRQSQGRLANALKNLAQSVDNAHNRAAALDPLENDIGAKPTLLCRKRYLLGRF
jgi:hypothetical protein